MGASASLSNHSVTVEPGETAICQITVRNTGNVVDQFDFTVVGDTDGWLTVEPPSLSLFPAAEGVAEVRFSPPRSATVHSGEVPFGIKVTSREDPAGSVVEEGTAQVGTFRELFAELVPRTSRGRRAARHDLALDNRGNGSVDTQLSAADPDNMLVFAFEPPALTPAPGTATFSQVKVAARRRFLKGPPVSRPFQVLVESDGNPPVPVDGTMVQEPVIPAWLPKALLGLLMALVLLAILWLTLLRPTIKSAAKDAAQEEIAAQEAADRAAGGGAGSGAGGGAGGGGTTDTTVAAEPGAGTAGQPVAGDQAGTIIGDRLFLTRAGVVSFTIPDGKKLELTDLVLQNPRGDVGTLRVQRNGTPLLVVALENFRDLDYHFVSPVVFQAGDELELAAECTNPPGTCTPGLYYSGVMKNA